MVNIDKVIGAIGDAKNRAMQNQRTINGIIETVVVGAIQAVYADLEARGVIKSEAPDAPSPKTVAELMLDEIEPQEVQSFPVEKPKAKVKRDKLPPLEVAAANG